MRRGLLVIDVQNEYFFGRLPVTHPPASLANILKAMDAATAHLVPVVVIQHAAKSDASPVFRQGSPEWELHPEVAKRRRDVLITKNWPDSFTETNLEGWLTANGIDTLTVCGYMTQMCCDTTARRAFHLGYRVEFLADATGTLSFQNEGGTVTDEELHRATLVAQGYFSAVLKTDDWLNRVRSEGAQEGVHPARRDQGDPRRTVTAIPPLFPEPIVNLPRADIPLPGVKAYLAQGESHQIVFMEFAEDAVVPDHAHGAQWGVVMAGTIMLTVAGEERSYGAGEHYFIPAGAVHAAKISAGYADISFFAERDRYHITTPRR